MDVSSFVLSSDCSASSMSIPLARFNSVTSASMARCLAMYLVKSDLHASTSGLGLVADTLISPVLGAVTSGGAVTVSGFLLWAAVLIENADSSTMTEIIYFIVPPLLKPFDYTHFL